MYDEITDFFQKILFQRRLDAILDTDAGVAAHDNPDGLGCLAG
jgi:hypothetical protein